MPRCFVIQPFDDGERYDKRYEDVFAPAIRDAKLEPYRVDHDPTVSVPINEIEKGIESSYACLVEISTDNPNVWFELGYAIASRRIVVLLCSDERDTPFPFDVQHRTIIRYSTESPSDFAKARSRITTQLKALLGKQKRLDQLATVNSVSRVEGLEQYETAGLVAVAQHVNDPKKGISAYQFREDMEQAGFTQLASTLALGSLIDREMLERYEEQDYDGETYTAFRVTSKGMTWLLANKGKLTLQISEKERGRTRITDDDIPF